MPQKRRDTEDSMGDAPPFEVAGSEAPSPRLASVVAVTIIKSKAETALVQWLEAGALKRGYVPLALVQEGQVDADELSAAAPYGVAWEQFLRPAALEIAEDLRREGIWTVRDLVSVNPRAAFDRFAGVLFGEFIVKVKEFENGQQ
jgi:hypothetical protein